MDVAACSNASAETAGDFIIAQIDVRAARRANCRSGCATDLLFSLTFETLDNRAALSLPKIRKSSKNRGALWRGCCFSRPELQARFRREWRKRAAALTTD